MAVAKFISEPQTIKLMPADTKEFLKTAEKAFEKHKDAMDKLNWKSWLLRPLNKLF